MKTPKQMNDSELGAAYAMNSVCRSLVASSRRFSDKSEMFRGTIVSEVYLTIAEELMALERDIESALP